jgi:D-sedoheptulose 7-phosphate isomerase
MNFIKDNFQTTARQINTFISSKSNLDNMEKAIEIIVKAYKSGKKGLACGNGGSACDAMHFAEELTGRFRNNRKAMPAISLMDASHITCVANDFGFDYIFSRGIEALGNSGDYLIAISTSGNSQNVINAVIKAKEMNISIIALLGKDGGKLKDMANVSIIIPGQTSDRIQELHILIIHTLIEGVERQLFPENYQV